MRVEGALDDDRSPAHHVEGFAIPAVDLAQTQPIGIRMRTDLEHPRDDDPPEPSPDGLDLLDRRRHHGEIVRGRSWIRELPG